MNHASQKWDLRRLAELLICIKLEESCTVIWKSLDNHHSQVDWLSINGDNSVLWLLSPQAGVQMTECKEVESYSWNKSLEPFNTTVHIQIVEQQGTCITKWGLSKITFKPNSAHGGNVLWIVETKVELFMKKTQHRWHCMQTWKHSTSSSWVQRRWHHDVAQGCSQGSP